MGSVFIIGAIFSDLLNSKLFSENIFLRRPLHLRRRS
jgi:hypothetical protein